jgi:hypothetical protein
MMKTPITITLLAILAFSFPALSQPIPALNPGFAEPLTREGTSGGAENSVDCGSIAPQANHVLQVEQPIPYLSFQVETNGGTPTMLVDGPSGRFCLLPHRAGGPIKYAGHGDPGTYNIYVGDRSGGSHSYILTVTQQRK